MVKHSQTIRRLPTNCFECVRPFCGFGAKRVKYANFCKQLGSGPTPQSYWHFQKFQVPKVA